jgi:hypothetical protein
MDRYSVEENIKFLKDNINQNKKNIENEVFKLQCLKVQNE